MANKGSHFADFVRFRPHTYTRTQQSLPPLWAAINTLKKCTAAEFKHLQSALPSYRTPIS